MYYLTHILYNDLQRSFQQNYLYYGAFTAIKSPPPKQNRPGQAFLLN